ncbi:hypothetical protein MTF65_02210 [Streptomyces sp. APSN-46.1]|uniref:hypothetical protein n=1 Tax=Streptomyces sp. APSN-46.1 TaxID=2929049 RepID=UPI001FB466C5|nr:hypothetical protein [Streptomyces sp. APSN-46.1]MCJ1676192.1 hypothetical protein [Streptomyces sp. APSN-46.1]
MADIRNTQAFKALAAQTEAELLTRGLDVVPVAVHNVLAHAVATVADRLDIQPRSALRYIEPSAIADQIAKAGDPAAEGAEEVHGVRPVRIDERRVPMPRWVCTRPLMALAQAVKYASNNGDSRTVQHAADLIFELGLVIGDDPDSDDVQIPVGVLDETAHALGHVAAQIETSGWSLCPCAEAHGQDEVDAKVPERLRSDAELARKMRAKADG